MDVLTLLAEARAAGLRITAERDRLVVTGPRTAAAMVRLLAEHKNDVLAALSVSAVGTTPANTEKNGSSADADDECEAFACESCGAAIGWRTGAGTVACWGCSPPPENAVKLLLLDIAEGRRWVDYAAEGNVEDIEPDSWEAADDWTDATPCCSTCCSCAGWVDLLDGWHCLSCSPPRRAERVLERREEILRRCDASTSPPQRQHTRN